MNRKYVVYCARIIIKRVRIWIIWPWSHIGKSFPCKSANIHNPFGGIRSKIAVQHLSFSNIVYTVFNKSKWTIWYRSRPPADKWFAGGRYMSQHSKNKNKNRLKCVNRGPNETTNVRINTFHFETFPHHTGCHTYATHTDAYTRSDDVYKHKNILERSHRIHLRNADFIYSFVLFSSRRKIETLNCEKRTSDKNKQRLFASIFISILLYTYMQSAKS